MQDSIGSMGPPGQPPMSGDRRLSPAISAQRRLNERRAGAAWVNGPQLAENYLHAYLRSLDDRSWRQSHTPTQ
jgi:hypothetical protein